MLELEFRPPWSFRLGEKRWRAGLSPHDVIVLGDQRYGPELPWRDLSNRCFEEKSPRWSWWSINAPRRYRCHNQRPQGALLLPAAAITVKPMTRDRAPVRVVRHRVSRIGRLGSDIS
jgi:hypothetical protein